MFEYTDVLVDSLPTYPPTVTGELRIILQVKDQFLMSFKYLESLQSLWDEQKRIVTKDFIIEQVKNGEFEIDQLEMELSLDKEMLLSRERSNDGLISELKLRGEFIVADSSKRRVKGCRTALFRSCHENLKDILLGAKDTGFITVLEGIAERIDAAQKELRNKLRPLLEYYKDIYYLQLHFTLALTQVSCYCMPLMTDTVSLVDRLFFWAERPEFELVRKSGQICDRLRDIYTRLQRILIRLYESVKFLQDRIELQRILEIKFYEKMRQLKQAKDDLLEEIHITRLQLDLIEEENDRLVGTLIKLDPTFIETDAFSYYSKQKHNKTESLGTASKYSKVSGSSKKKPNMGNSIETSDVSVIKMPNKMQQLVESASSNNQHRSKNVKGTSNNTQQVKLRHSNSHNSDHKNKVKMEKLILNFREMFDELKQNSKSETNLIELDNIRDVEKLPDIKHISPDSNDRSRKYVVEQDLSNNTNQTTDALVLSAEMFSNKS